MVVFFEETLSKFEFIVLYGCQTNAKTSEYIIRLIKKDREDHKTQERASAEKIPIDLETGAIFIMVKRSRL